MFSELNHTALLKSKGSVSCPIRFQYLKREVRDLWIERGLEEYAVYHLTKCDTLCFKLFPNSGGDCPCSYENTTFVKSRFWHKFNEWRRENSFK